MAVLVDTSVWSLALRRIERISHPEVDALRKIIESEEQIYLIGIVIQELLQGLRSKSDFAKIRNRLAAFPILKLKRVDYIFAAKLSNHCASKGVHASTIDFLIAAVAIRYGLDLFTSDKDFGQIASHTELKLFNTG